MSIVIYEGSERFAYTQGQSKIYFKLIPAARRAELFAAAIVEGKRGESPAYHNSQLYAQLCVTEAVYGWDGVIDRKREPIPFNPDALKRLVTTNSTIASVLHMGIQDPLSIEGIECLDDAEKPVALTEAEKKD